MHIAPNQEPALEIHSRAAPSVEAHHRVNGPDLKKKHLKIRQFIEPEKLIKMSQGDIDVAKNVLVNFCSVAANNA